MASGVDSARLQAAAEAAVSELIVFPRTGYLTPPIQKLHEVVHSQKEGDEQFMGKSC